MKIHTVKEGESLTEIAKEYGVCREWLARVNELEGGTLAVGEEVLIPLVTRTHRVSRGDTPERLALRYGVRIGEILKMNPQMNERGLCEGEIIAVKGASHSYGTAVCNGYVYPGCSEGRLRLMLPYLTYVTVGAVVCENDGARFIFDAGKIVKMATENDKIPLLRVCDRDSATRLRTATERERYIQTLISLAKSGGYKGIVFGGGCDDRAALGDFLLEMKKNIIGSDLILFTELDSGSQRTLCDSADGCIFSYSKLAEGEGESFEMGEEKAYEEFAEECDSIKTLIDLFALAKGERGYLSLRDALSKARNSGTKITKDSRSLLCSFDHKRDGKYSYASLENIKATLALLSEYGYMGISFDVMRTPMSFLVMFSEMYSTAQYSNVRTREGCSRVGEE